MRKQNSLNFTDKALRKIELTPDSRVSYYDTREPGLLLRVGNVKTFCVALRVDGKPTLVTLGRFPDLTVDEARARALRHRNAVQQGTPLPVKNENPQDAVAVSEEWIARHVLLNTDWGEATRVMRSDIQPVLRGKLISEVTKPDVLRILDAFIDRDSRVMANRALGVLNGFLNWCVSRGYLVVSPAAGVKRPTKEESRDRYLSAEELSRLLPVLDRLPLLERTFIWLSLMLAQRRGELQHMRFSDVDFAKAMWTLPKASTKARRIHDVPLCPAAVDLLKALPRGKSDYVFGEALKNRWFVKLVIRLNELCPGERFHLHDLRRTAATAMAESGVPPHVLAAILNHSPGKNQGITAVYNRHRYTEERRAALTAWAEKLKQLAEGTVEERKVG